MLPICAQGFSRNCLTSINIDQRCDDYHYNERYMKINYRIHAVERMFERGISARDIRAALEAGETIESYEDEAAYPARLVLVLRGKRALHVVAADNVAGDETIVITAYRPERRRWSDDFKRRRDDLPDV